MTSKSLFGLAPKAKTKPEKTSQRDMKLSGRHRLYGLHINQEDIDFLEYDEPGNLIALIEYKLTMDINNARPPRMGESNYSNLVSLEELGNRASIPVFLTFYNPDFKYWKIFPINRFALKASPPKEKITEYSYVTFLHWLRKREVPESVKQYLYGGGF